MAYEKMRTRPAIFWLSFALVSLMLPGVISAGEKPASDSPLWPAPRDGCMLVEPSIGYSEGLDISGTTLSLSGLFTFRYFMVGLHGQVVFSASGPLYDMSLDLNIRYGPIYTGVSAVGHWFPGDSADIKPGAAASFGVYVPLPIDGVFLDLSYRPVFVFLKSRTMLFHEITCGAVFEIGS